MSGNRPIVIGLTGGAAMGKSTILSLIQSLDGDDVLVMDADAEIHTAYGDVKHPLVQHIVQHFGEPMVQNGRVDRQRLGAVYFDLDYAKKRAAFESAVHDFIVAQSKAVIARAVQQNVALVVLDVPLLMEDETGDLVGLCDGLLMAHCDEKVQQARIMKRVGMTTEKMQLILGRQLSASERLERAKATGKKLMVIVTDDPGEPSDSDLFRQRVKNGLLVFYPTVDDRGQ